MSSTATKAKARAKVPANPMDAVGLDFVRPEKPSPGAGAEGLGSRSMSRVYENLERLQDSDPQWFAQFEDSDLMSMSAFKLVQLLDTAPNYLAQGYMAGILSARLHLSQVAGRPLFDQ